MATLLIPDFDVPDLARPAAKRDGPSAAAGADYLTDRKNFISSFPKLDNDSLETDRATSHFKFEGSERSSIDLNLYRRRFISSVLSSDMRTSLVLVFC